MSSGRRRWVNLGDTDSARVLDIRALRRKGLIRAGLIARTVWAWKRGDNDCGSVSLIACAANPQNAVLTVVYEADGQDRKEIIRLEALPCRYGGHRFYFRCPASGRRCEVLAWVDGYFACRQHHRLTYASQSEGPLDRLGRRVRKVEAQAFGGSGFSKPRGAKRKRLVRKWMELSSAWDEAVHSEGTRRFRSFAL